MEINKERKIHIHVHGVAVHFFGQQRWTGFDIEPSGSMKCWETIEWPSI
jgi:hypothetical protein